ncbi:unnamed protein product [Peniophora sp. CBMAI 1063]|nr:unnamed protein product [Peniophora sp. CBMAI 1063]
MSLSMLFALLSILAIAVAAQVWSKYRSTRGLRNLPGPPSGSLIAGNLPQIYGPFAGSFRSQLIYQYGKVVRIAGLFGGSQLLLSDVRALRNVLVENPDAYDSEDVLLALGRVTFGPGLVATTGDRHRVQRKIIEPAFTGSNMRKFFPSLQDLYMKLPQMLSLKANSPSGGIVDVAALLGKLSLESIGIVCFNHSFHALEYNTDDFVLALESYFPTLSKVQHLIVFLPILLRWVPSAVLRKVGELLPWRTLRELFQIVDVLHRHSSTIHRDLKNTPSDRGPNLPSNRAGIKSLASVLMHTNEQAQDDDRMPDEEIVAHISVLLFTGTDTSAALMSRILQLLSENPAAQDRLREELSSAEDLEYDTVMNLPYLDAIFKETLRMFPSVPLVTRQARVDTVIPFSEALRGRDGEDLHSVHVPKGTTIITDIAAVNLDETLWGEDAKIWKPARWIEGIPASVINSRLPSAYSHLLTFLAGRRYCPGMNFAHILTKSAIAYLIRNYTFEPSGDEIVWRSSVVALPTVKGHDQPALTMRVTVVQRSYVL